MASAPELLQAVIDMLPSLIDTHGNQHPMVLNAIDLINKATTI